MLTIDMQGPSCVRSRQSEEGDTGGERGRDVQREGCVKDNLQPRSKAEIIQSSEQAEGNSISYDKVIANRLFTNVTYRSLTSVQNWTRACCSCASSSAIHEKFTTAWCTGSSRLRKFEKDAGLLAGCCSVTELSKSDDRTRRPLPLPKHRGFSFPFVALARTFPHFGFDNHECTHATAGSSSSSVRLRCCNRSPSQRSSRSIICLPRHMRDEVVQ